ncbi:MAG: hypothetical protein ACPLY7_00755 [Microgenomates group bacterium]
MKLFFGEFKANYSNYFFPYQVWLLREEGDQVEKIYDNGFLPIRSLPNVYYLSRNVRVALDKFELSSENRRILKKTENFESDLVPLSEFVYNAEVQKFCKDYVNQRLGRKLFSSASVRSIFSGRVFNYVFVFKKIPTQESVGYAVCFISGSILQYAHAFYDVKYFRDNLGARMMLEAVIWAKRSHKKYVYLGTCYEPEALYKTEFKGVEFFNGFRWSNDLSELKGLLSQQSGEYLLKQKEFLKRFYQGDLQYILNKYGVRVNF